MCVFSKGVACERLCRPVAVVSRVALLSPPSTPLWRKGGRSGDSLAAVGRLSQPEGPCGLG